MYLFCIIHRVRDEFGRNMHEYLRKDLCVVMLPNIRARNMITLLDITSYQNLPKEKRRDENVNLPSLLLLFLILLHKFLPVIMKPTIQQADLLMMKLRKVRFLVHHYCLGEDTTANMMAMMGFASFGTTKVGLSSFWS